MARWRVVIESKENADEGRAAAASGLGGATATDRRRQDEVKIGRRTGTGRRGIRAGKGAVKRIERGDTGEKRRKRIKYSSICKGMKRKKKEYKEKERQGAESVPREREARRRGI